VTDPVLPSLPLSALLLSSFEPPRPELTSTPELEGVLTLALKAARAAWPDLTLSDAAYFRFLSRHLARSADPTSILRTMHTTDMFLAAACVADDPRALAIFDSQVLAATSPMVLRMGIAPDVVEEARQVLRQRFFVGEGGGPKILEYSGTGRLRKWAQAALARAAFRVVREPAARTQADSASLVAVASTQGDLELDYLKRVHGAEAHSALHEGFADLEIRERNLLRQHFGLGLDVDALAAFYRVHRVTAWRWVTKAREALATRTREALARRLGMARDEVSSMVRLLQSQLEEDLRGLVGTPVES
jgi:RNA polymerase sigma-70 factor (ECF subfamily)